MKEATFYHAGCPVCVNAENAIVHALDPQQYKVNVIHLAEQSNLIEQASQAGVKSVPALLIDGQVLHINHGADLTALK